MDRMDGYGSKYGRPSGRSRIRSQGVLFRTTAIRGYDGIGRLCWTAVFLRREASFSLRGEAEAANRCVQEALRVLVASLLCATGVKSLNLDNTFTASALKRAGRSVVQL